MVRLKTVVVARYQEDVSWVYGLNESVRVVVVTKGADLPMISREDASFFWYIITHYDELEGHYYFCQARPQEHSSSIIGAINDHAQVPDYEEYGDEQLVGNNDGNPHHAGLRIKEVYERLFKKPSPQKFPFKKGGGQFVVSAERIKERPKEFYEEAFRVCEDEKDAAWIYERLWGSVFG